ncbi:MAG TPA: transcription antitermination factor NusB [Candidatus Binatia bacterium]|nr:transcription antitermination factor NusB [Candidatus Binatia bacterium]
MMRSSRRKGREAALQLLYQTELSGEPDQDALELFWQSHPVADETGALREFAEALVQAVLEHSQNIDRMIDAATANWDMDRLSRVDLSLLRLAAGELLAFPETPAAVVINEAVEIARRFSDERAASFINGVLDRVAREHGRIQGK